ncbi:MAG: hypothetical protein ACTH31_06970 [Pseudoclavibacter sp.]
MPRDAVLLSTDPIRLMELGETVQRRPERLGVQGIDRGGSAAIMHPDGRLVCSVQAPVRLETVAELHRLRPDAPDDAPIPCFWHDAWVASGDDALGVECLESLAAMTRGVLVLSPAAS